MAMSIRVVLAEDHEVVRKGLRSLLEKEPDFKVVGEAGGGRKAVELAEKLKPDVMVMDITMPDLNGVEATRAIQSQAKGVRVLALSIHSSRRFVQAMLGAGASGYLMKHSSAEELSAAVRAVSSGQTYLSPQITGMVIAGFLQDTAKRDSAVPDRLTPREREVLQLIAEGHSSKEIAFRFQLSVKTVNTHREHIVQKLKLRSIAELTKYAVREGMTPLEK